MEMTILATLCLGILGVALLLFGITGAFKKIHGAGVAIAFGTIFILTALVIVGLIPPLF